MQNKSHRSRIFETILLTLFLVLSFRPTTYGADHVIPFPGGGMEEYFWTYGCTPTAASMVLGYWDSWGWHGNLIDYYLNSNDFLSTSHES